jgi:methyl-accepting chemotaxis protein
MATRSFKGKIIVLVLIPFLALIGLASFELMQVRNRLTMARQTKIYSDFFATTSRLVHELQIERGKTSLFLNGKLAKSEVSNQRAEADKRRTDVEALLGNRSLPAGIADQMRDAITGLDAVRALADGGAAAKDVVRDYSNHIQSMLKVLSIVSLSSTMEGFEGRMMSLATLEFAKENMGRLRASVAAIIAADQAISIASISDIERFRNGMISNLNSPLLKVSDQARQELVELQKSGEWATVFGMIDSVLQNSDKGHFGLSASDYFKIASSVMDRVSGTVRSEVNGLEREAADVERTTSQLFYIVLGAGFVLALTLIVFSGAMIRKMVAQLSIVADRLERGAQNILKSAKHMAEIGGALADSTSEQAALAQKTVSAVQEVSAMVDRNASHAKSSEEKANEGSGAAEQGRESVLQVITSIQEIQIASDEIGSQVENSNRELSEIVRIIGEIGEKTNVINDIVFQTRLLSFNASVEAARAGDAGKGFAVVAEEVGKLAQMSGAAAAEIRQMLTQGTQQVEGIVTMSRANVESLLSVAREKIDRGTAISHQCGEIIDQLRQNVGEVSAMATEVARASEEQSKGIQEISSAMVDIDRSNHANARISDEVHTAAEGLQVEVAELEESMGQLHEIVAGRRAA